MGTQGPGQMGLVCRLCVLLLRRIALGPVQRQHPCGGQTLLSRPAVTGGSGLGGRLYLVVHRFGYCPRPGRMVYVRLGLVRWLDHGDQYSFFTVSKTSH